MKTMENVNKGYKHYIYKEIGLIKGYKLLNETSESEGVIINNITIEINQESEIGREFYREIKDKFTPETLPKKYATEANYIYKETEENEMIYIAIKNPNKQIRPEGNKSKEKAAAQDKQIHIIFGKIYIILTKKNIKKTAIRSGLKKNFTCNLNDRITIRSFLLSEAPTVRPRGARCPRRSVVRFQGCLCSHRVRR